MVAEGCAQLEQVASCSYGKGVGEGRISDAKVSEPGAQRGLHLQKAPGDEESAVLP